MTDFAAARRMMVDGQLRTFDITDQAVLAAMLAVPRERFIPATSAGIAYLDTELGVGSGGKRRLLTPMVFGRLLQVAEISPDSHILDVGSANGYSAAVISRLSDKVVALEEDPGLAHHARRELADIGAANVSVVEGPLAAGWQEAGPYDVIVVNGLCEVVPAALLDQLGENGRLVTVVGSGPAPKAIIYRRADGKITGRPVFDAAAPPLAGFARQPVFQF